MYKKYINIIKRNEKPELVLKNGNVINVFTKEIIKTDIAISDGIIVGLGDFSSENEIDCTGKFICPGFIDAHIHIESSMLAPDKFANLISLNGTTTIIADPHEIVNVCGSRGMKFMLDSTEKVNCDVYYMLPSCVPATKFESNFSDFTAKDMKEFKNHKRVLGLGEIMDYESIVNCDDSMYAKVRLFKDMVIDAHAPFLSFDDLQIYKIAGALTDHESSIFEDALNKIRLGFYVFIREGSAARNLDDVLSLLIKNNIPLDRCCFCTDDKHVDDILQNGHMTTHIKKAVKLGLSPIDAIKLCTINPANCYGLKNIGALSVGYKANIVILDDLEKFNINKVFYNGKLVTKNNDKKSNIKLDTKINCRDINKEDLKIIIKKDQPVDVIELVSNQILTKHEKYSDIKCDENDLFTPYDDFLKILVIERHHKKTSFGIGIIKGYGLKNGAIASTVSHDSHNIIIVGDNDNDILIAFNKIKEIGGGYVISNNSELQTLKLSIAGLMSDDEENFVNDLHNIINKAYDMGVKRCFDPLITLSFLALPVIPEIRITDKGLFDVKNYKFINY